MINLIYTSFPYGNAEAFAEYEIPYINKAEKENYRIFSFCRKDENKRNVSIEGEVHIVRPNAFEYLRGLLHVLTPHGIKELGCVKKRVCRDSLSRCLWRIAYYRAYAYALNRKYKKLGGDKNGDVFVSYWLTECAYAALYVKQKHKNVKAVSRGHGFDLYEERCYLPFRAELLSGLDRVYLVNNAEREYLLKRYTVPEDKLSVSHLGIDLPPEYKTTSDRGSFTILSCSSVIQLKRLDLLVDALAQIKDFKFKWIHIGGGPLFEAVKEAAKKKLCEPTQEFVFPGQLTLEEVHRLYRENDISLFVNCSDTEGVPVSVMEAMSYGIPVAARDVGGNSEIVNDKNGILIKKDCTPSDLAEAIRKIYNCSEEEYTKLRRTARQTVEEDFSAEIQYTGFFKELKNII